MGYDGGVCGYNGSGPLHHWYTFSLLSLSPLLCFSLPGLTMWRVMLLFCSGVDIPSS